MAMVILSSNILVFCDRNILDERHKFLNCRLFDPAICFNIAFLLEILAAEQPGFPMFCRDNLDRSFPRSDSNPVQFHPAAGGDTGKLLCELVEEVLQDSVSWFKFRRRLDIHFAE